MSVVVDMRERIMWKLSNRRERKVPVWAGKMLLYRLQLVKKGECYTNKLYILLECEVYNTYSSI